LVVYEALLRRIDDLQFFHDFLRALFSHRRKFLRSALQSAWTRRLSRADIDTLLAAAEISPQCRAEQLDVPTILRLADAVRQTPKSPED
jgi:16S rRNA (adenine1518-N6/adenine1519-N6)-dimethyltransferase